MENWFRHLFLGLLYGLFLNTANAAEPTADEGGLIQPEVKRIQFDEAQINGDDFEIMLFAGYLSIEDFGVNSMLSAKFNYYVNESIFVQIALAKSTASETSYEILSGGAPLLTDSERELKSYAINLGYNLLPGEAFPTMNKAFNTAFFISGGIGNTTFAGSDRFTWNYGAGLRFLLNDSFSLYGEFRNNVLDVDVFGVTKSTNNLEFTIGTGWFF
jgi:outer membrane beta-barrel protein